MKTVRLFRVVVGPVSGARRWGYDVGCDRVLGLRWVGPQDPPFVVQPSGRFRTPEKWSLESRGSPPRDHICL